MRYYCERCAEVYTREELESDYDDHSGLTSLMCPECGDDVEDLEDEDDTDEIQEAVSRALTDVIVDIARGLRS